MPKSSRGETHAHAGAGPHHLAHVGHVIQDGGLENLDFQGVGPGAGHVGQGMAHPLGKIGQLQVAAGDIDADAGLQPGAAPGDGLGQGLAHGPLAETDDEVAAFHHRQEFSRRHHAPLRMEPAQQGLEAEHPAAGHVHLGLVVQPQFLVLHGQVESPQHLPAGVGALVLLAVEEAEIAPGPPAWPGAGPSGRGAPGCRHPPNRRVAGQCRRRR